MNDQEMKCLLEKAFPSLPPLVDARVRETIAHREGLKSPAAMRIIPRALLAALLVLGISAAAAVALRQMGVLHFTQSYLKETYYDALPQAQELVQKDLAAIERPEVTVSVKEAVYDGRVLNIVYSIKRRNATAPFDPQAVENGQYACDVQDNGGMGACDWLVVNGVEVELTSIATAAGEGNGEILYLVESDLTPPGGVAPLRPTGKMTVGLPIQCGGERPRVPDGLEFTMEAGDAATHYSIKLPGPMDLRGCRVQFTDLHFSPLSVYISYSITIPAGMAAGKTQEELDKMLDGMGHGILVNDRGEQLGAGKGGPDGWVAETLENGDVIGVVNSRFSPGGQYTPVIYCVTRDGDRLPIPMTPMP